MILNSQQNFALQSFNYSQRDEQILGQKPVEDLAGEIQSFPTVRKPHGLGDKIKPAMKSLTLISKVIHYVSLLAVVFSYQKIDYQLKQAHSSCTQAVFVRHLSI